MGSYYRREICHHTRKEFRERAFYRFFFFKINWEGEISKNKKIWSLIFCLHHFAYLPCGLRHLRELLNVFPTAGEKVLRILLSFFQPQVNIFESAIPILLSAALCSACGSVPDKTYVVTIVFERAFLPTGGKMFVCHYMIEIFM